MGLKKRKDEEGEEGDEDGGKSGYLKGELGMKGEEAGLDGEGGGVVWSVDEEGRKLALGRMKLHWVPAGVTAYRNIVSLDLSRNSLSFLPSFLGKLLKLKVVLWLLWFPFPIFFHSFPFPQITHKKQ